MIRVVLIDDHDMLRQGLLALFDSAADVEVVAQARTGTEGIDQVKQLCPDVVVCDVCLQDMHGIQVTEAILDIKQSARVVALSMHSDPQFVTGMLHAGASAYVLKDQAFGELLNAVRAVANGQMFLSPAVAGVLAGEYHRRDEDVTLSRREREVLCLLVEGQTTKQAAMALHVSSKTVETHRRNIMRKLGIDNIAQLTKYALRKGMTRL